jgi:hypothetical protein
MSNYPVPEEILKKEANVFCNYLLGEGANGQTVQLYIAANNKLAIELNAKEQRRLTYLLKFPVLIPSVDAALAIVSPGSGIRKKLYILFCIAESIPGYSHYFLPEKSPGIIIVSVLYRMFLAGVRLLFGLILLLWI